MVANCSLTLTQFITSEYDLSQREERHSANFFRKHEASRPSAPSTDNMKGVNEARLTSATSEYFFHVRQMKEQRPQSGQHMTGRPCR